MKQQTFNNIVFFLLLIILLVVSVFCFVISLNLISRVVLSDVISHYIDLFYTTFYARILLGMISLLILLAIIYLVWKKIRISREFPSIKQNTEFGEINISTGSINQIILSILRDINGIKQVRPEIQVLKTGGINTVLHLTVNQNLSIPEAAKEIQEKLKKRLYEVSGIETKEIKINVEKIDYEEEMEKLK
jgi:uncharacterized alkaline shock family protein YloU